MKNVNFDLDANKLDSVECKSCECNLFTPSFLIKKVSALQSPTGQQMMAPIQVFRCDNCGEVLNEFND